MWVPNATSLNAFEICLVPDVSIPTKFKVLEFYKYKGPTCPNNHLKMYCRKMEAHICDDKLMMYCFQDSLTEASLEWYMQLEMGSVESWDDLDVAFVKQYKYNVDLAPNRT